MRFTNSHATDIRQVAPRTATPFLSAHRNDWWVWGGDFVRPMGRTFVTAYRWRAVLRDV